jgi:hypothetical protein
MRGHASFFVPSDTRGIVVPLRATFDRPGEWPIIATITIDDRPIDRVLLASPEWRRVVIPVPRGSRRRGRRIDIRVDRMRDEAHAIQVGQIETR